MDTPRTVDDQQLLLWDDPPLGCVPVCHRCGAHGQPIPIPAADDDWWPAVAWSLCTLTAHARDCPGAAP